ncbi:uncharacterized protein OCT59_007297 [Rhizophagus irregularis]|uniref:Uncharacterized protein n=1 Tax=Rhizophagus irregularis (strain DAOM 181602 / DAOM 197198 / MUCL 43194) TaxID=747089 RepID=A0A2P4QLE3_RHIID|nr:hypothetical protein GLOIN_2v1766637 [Rhizophagus irregularis DAOM 181602=DAOM 197198]POG78454.1 hypothetical protein GLOIN_2v1766637 [Rhizophagus irregularis DAOM 181602=DAOM 197198]UZO15887.1 hypothetical protein OCT59_007297 [Rhizophagus irregularis]GBC33064.2 hypothetical protein GLOIN_2v1766637 [Rhizophagus irregularis DAOM 181602=DAOM 197198]|eukprot:XP_025185320.1 hypothetical protein GLOIN_2v1766637 [Rhizophagus irregularis DAOM 181602=DAOM 197198]
MDGTFKTVPTSFKQLYTIHESVESSENSQIMPLVFSLISMQAFGLASQYASDKNISLFVRYIPALAFLPCNNIPAAFDELRSNMPLNMLPEVNELLDWFEIYYIHKKVIHRLRNGNVVCSEPLFPPSL